MYAGTTLKPLRNFDAWFGAHQKIDRVAYRKLGSIMTPQQQAAWPSYKQIRQFEGFDGPDGIKRKTPAQDELWHFYDPNDADDTRILEIIDSQFDGLVKALRAHNKTRAGFEAAWLAHGLVDGLTPAHHYPYEAELVRLRGGQDISTRTTPKEKLLMHGNTMKEKLKNNWQMWGDKGLITTHFAFEWGVAMTILPMRFTWLDLSDAECVQVMQKGHQELFVAAAHDIAVMDLYTQFYNSGWTPRLIKRVRRELSPRIIKTVALTWYEALQKAGL